MIKNIIFDLGGVIINLDFNLTVKAFQELGAINFAESYVQNKEFHLFDDYETGKISSEEFRAALKQKLDITVSDEEFDIAWNAMLLDLPMTRLKLIKDLAEKYRVFLFSNTNEIHLKEVFNICKRQNGFNSFQGYFEKEYYSHLLGQRKPNPDAFIAILKENNLNADETLFIDDSMLNVEGAKAAGLHAIYLSPDKSIFDTKHFIEVIDDLLETPREIPQPKKLGFI